MKRIILFTLFTILFVCEDSKSQSKSERIPLETIEGMFSRMRDSGVNPDTTLLWGYFFIAKKSSKFEQVKTELKAKNFEFVEISKGKGKNHWLHLQRKEVHNPKSLYEVNEDLDAVAEKYKITYDGFDVGNLDPTKPLKRNTYAVPEDYKTANLQKENFPFLLVGNVAFDRFPHKSEFKYFIKISSVYKTDAKIMLPSFEEMDKLEQFESNLMKYLTENKIKNYYVFRETHKGYRNFFLVTNNSSNTNEALNLLKKSNTFRHFDFSIIEDEKWDLYEDMKAKFSKK